MDRGRGGRGAFQGGDHGGRGRGGGEHGRGRGRGGGGGEYSGGRGGRSRGGGDYSGGRGGRGRGGGDYSGDRGGRGRGDHGGHGRGRGDYRGRSRGGRGRGGDQSGFTTLEVARERTTEILAPLRLESDNALNFEDLPNGQFVPRPDSGGTVGRKVDIKTNFFAMDCNVESIHHYDIEIRSHESRILTGDESEEVERMPPKLNRAILAQCLGQGLPSAFDGRKNLYAPSKLFNKKTENFTVTLSTRGREKKFDVKVSQASVIKPAAVENYLRERSNVEIPHQLKSALEICLKDAFARDPNYSCFGRSIFSANQGKMPLFGGTELWQGHSQSIRLTENGLALNLDMAYAVFLAEQPVLEYIQALTNERNPNALQNFDPRQWRRLGQDLKGINVMTTHSKRENGKTHKIKGLTLQAAEDTMFTTKDGTELTVAGYWQQKYGPLQYPWLRCLDVSKTRKKPNYIPIEVCKIAPGQRKAKLTPDLTRELIKQSAKSPSDRQRGIADILRRSGFNKNPLISAFGMNIQENEVQVDARVLPQPFLRYNHPPAMDTGPRGAWNLDGVVLYQGASVTSWAVASFLTDNQLRSARDGIDNFLHGLIDMMKKMGLKVNSELPPVIDGGRISPKQALENASNEAKNKFKKPPEIVLVILPRKESWPYKEIKRISEGELGLMTQCVVASSAGIDRPPKGEMQYRANLVLKINQKFGGKNCTFASPLSDLFPVISPRGQKPYIIFGADVTHPVTHDVSEPSVGAIVASMDNELSSYCARSVVLPHRQESLDMSDAIVELLQCFREKNNVRPEVVIFYRDGVSDGQFESVLSHEYNEFQQAFKKLDANYRPTMTYIVVKKRHHARMFPVTKNDGDYKGNALPGTVIDSEITSKYDFDFYLNSQAGIQGTNKPAHYYALLDENGFGSDGLQLFTYWMCYLYCRCTRSVSYAPPAYYAHLAALHGKYLTNASDSDYASTIGDSPPEYQGLHEALKGRMFFV